MVDSIVDANAHNFPTLTYSLPTVQGVTFQQDGVTTYKGWQYATYYQGNSANSSGKVAVARRSLPNGPWESLVLSDYIFTTVDSHNDVVMGICPGDGSIHLSFDHHGSILKYRISVPGAADNPATVQWTPALFGAVSDHLLTGGSSMTAVTYPRFIPTPAGKLLFTYRYGGSGGGDEILYEYDGSSHAWSLIGQYVSRSGSYTGPAGTSTERNAYFDNTCFGANGRLHATWCWRETAGANSNHDILYAYSDDVGRTWKNQLGATLAISGTSSISLNSPGLIGWNIPQNRNYINNSAMITDGKGRVHVVAWHLPDAFPDDSGFDATIASNARFHHYWRGTDGVWRRNPTAITGTRAKLAADDDGRLFLIYGDATNIRIAAANPAANPEATPASSWNDWTPLNLSGALPEGKANKVNIITDPVRWEKDRIISVYAQETNPSGTAPTPLHVLDYHVSRAAVLPSPASGSTIDSLNPNLSWTAGQTSVTQDVYFGTDKTSVANATPGAPEYLGRLSGTPRPVGPLAPTTSYHWRVDSVDAVGRITPGRIWSFAVGDLMPEIKTGGASRSYGGRATFLADLALHDDQLISGDATLYYGTTDGGTDAAVWQQAVGPSPHNAGKFSVVVDAIPDQIVYYRFRATTTRGSTWAAASGILENIGDLSRWEHTALISPTGYSGTETLTDFPVLVRLSSATLSGFSYQQMLSPPYGDLRFSTEDGAILPYEIESWNPSGISLIWVKLPSVSSATRFRMWWGKSGVSAPVTQPDVWSGGFGGVWHLDPALGVGKDSSALTTAGTATAITPTSTGVIAGAAAFDGVASNIAIANGSALNPALISVEAWVRTSSTAIMSIFSKDQTGVPLNRVWQFRINAGKPEFIVFSSNTANAGTLSPDAVNDGQFHHLCGTWDGAVVRLHVDGVLKSSVTFTGSLNPGKTNAAYIGRMQTATPSYFNGTLDEVRLSSTARSGDWIRATWANQMTGSSFLTVSPASAPDLDRDHLPDTWEMAHFQTIRTQSADSDHDGSVNLLEYALGTDPASSGGPSPVAFVAASGGALPEFVYQQRAGGAGEIGTTYTAGGLRYTVECSSGLMDWESGPTKVTWSNRRESLGDGMERVGVYLLPAGNRLFARIKVVTVE